jgi:hypothetical protein
MSTVFQLDGHQFNKGVCKKNVDLVRGPSMIDMKTENAQACPHPLLRRPAPQLNLNDIHPQPGMLYHLAGPGHAGRGMRPVAEHWVAHALAAGHTVHWVDGACRIDPSRLLAPLARLQADTEACLARLYLSRGFTLHQLDKQIERLSQEVQLTRSPMIVVDGLLAMHEDDAIKRLESRTLLKRHARVLQRLAQHHRVAVVIITEQRARTPHLGRLLRHLHVRCDHHLLGEWQGSRRQRQLFLRHPRTGLQGRWDPELDRRQTRFVLQPREFGNRTMPPSTGALTLHHGEW